MSNVISLDERRKAIQWDDYHGEWVCTQAENLKWAHHILRRLYGTAPSSVEVLDGGDCDECGTRTIIRGGLGSVALCRRCVLRRNAAAEKAVATVRPWEPAQGAA